MSTLGDRWTSRIARLTADATTRRVILLATGVGSTLAVLALAWWMQQPVVPPVVARVLVADPAAVAGASTVEQQAGELEGNRDEAGRLLASGSDAADPFAGRGFAIDYQRRVERFTEERIESLLATIVGPGKAVVRVAATIDFSRTERTEELVDPDRTAVRKSHASREGTPATRGAAGATGQADARGADAASPRTERRDESQEYEVSKTTSRTVAPMGAVTQLSVAVLIDGTYREEGAARVFVPRTDAELETLKTLVASAVGISDARGDRLEVTSVPFQPEAGAEAGVLAGAAAWMPALVLRLLGVALVLGVLAFVVRPLVRALGGPGAAARPTDGSLAPDAEVAVGDFARENIALAQQHPERAAQLVRQWLVEGQQRTL